MRKITLEYPEGLEQAVQTTIGVVLG